MSIGAPWWQQQLVSNVTTLAMHGADSVQLDNWPVTAYMDDFSVGHPSGKGGTWQTAAWLSTLQAIRTAVSPINSSFALGSEQAAEVFLPSVDLYDSSDCMAELSDPNVGTSIAEAVPLFSFVYHPYIHGKCEFYYGLYNDSYDGLVFGRAAVWGQIPESHQTSLLTASYVSPAMVAYSYACSVPALNPSARACYSGKNQVRYNRFSSVRYLSDGRDAPDLLRRA